MAYNLKSEEDVKEYLKNLGTEYRFGCYNEKKPEVCHLLGNYLEAISKDFDKAGKVYKSNCDDYNFAKSCLKTANYMVTGRGGFKASEEKGLEYYEKGCKLGDADSCFRCGLLNVLSGRKLDSFKTYVKGIGQLQQSCEGGNHADACFHLSSIYIGPKDNSSKTVPHDMRKAFEYGVRSCQLGNMFACANVSLMYRQGDGVEKDQAKSESYRQRALELKRELENNRRTINFQEGLKPI
ncbi:hypothetical protein AAG570_011688 [Ranatra chinensis]|uniref:Cytochrome c oxidase assembly factor 7 n=1 Tax=Ranatra chinensis TaxID=642074 RepID=A0ABD0YGL2_9HEMI